MADRRKLQGEIERCLKKITEGVEIFEDIWQKIVTAPNVAMKEKHEADLKKEIKKLQRLRDQIKTWLAASDIKDKKTLLDSKKHIEVQMERFKVIERETKTKAYSKEGLGAATKVDPKEKEKEDITNWLSTSIEELNVQIDQFESEIESAGSKKKKLDKERQDVVESNKQHVETHRHHIDRLETIMRLLNNDALDVQQIMGIKDDVQYYISSNREPDFEANEFLYDDLHLDEVSATLGSGLGSTGLSHDDNESGMSETSETLSNQNSSSPSPSPSLTATSCSSQHSKSERDEIMSSRPRLRSSTSESRSHKADTQLNGPSSSMTPSTNHSKVAVTSNKLPAVTKSSSSEQQKSSATASSSATVTAAPAATLSSHDPITTVVATITSSSTSTHSQNYAQAAGSAQLITQLSNSSTTSVQSVERKDAGIKPSSDSVSALDNITVTSNWNSRPSPLLPPVTSAWGDHTTTTTTSIKQSSTHQLLSLAAAAKGQLQSANGQPAVSQGAGDEGVAKVNGPMPVSGGVASLAASTQISTPISTTAIPPLLTPGLTSGGPLLTPLTPGGSTGPSLPLSNIKSITQQVLDSLPPSARPDIVSPLQRNPIPASLSEYQSLMSKPSAGTGSGSMRLHPLLGVTPLGPQPLDRVSLIQMAMLEAGSYHLPMPDDSERVRFQILGLKGLKISIHLKISVAKWTYFPRNPTPLVPPYYTYLPPQVTDNIEFFSRLSIETLFFIFYYMEGTKAQYLSAKALKAKSWRFHTKLLMWFQRHEEPKVITEEYEQGSYLYFDFEAWVQRQHDTFTFEYRYLEDHELV